MSAQPPPILRYAATTTPPWRRPRFVVSMALAVVCVLAAYRYWPGLYGRMQVLYWQRQCLVYRFDPATPAYDEAPLRSPVTQPVPPPPTRFEGSSYRILGSAQRTTAHQVTPVALAQLGALVNGRITVQPAIFVHGRRALGGPERLVVVHVAAGRDVHTPSDVFFIPGTPLLEAVVFSPATVGADPTLLNTSGLIFDALRQVPTGRLAFYGGQPDPADRSHFIIDVRTPAGRGMIDGWLRPDDTVRWHVRPGRAVPGPAPK